jgi:hypothetical protein
LVAYKKKENRALNLIVQSLSNNQLFIVWTSSLQKAFGCSLNMACGQGPTQHAILDSKFL